jgi:tetratricopeptide (TPR) repeat protein
MTSKLGSTEIYPGQSRFVRVSYPLALAAVLVLFCLETPAQAQTHSGFSAEQILNFANHLFSQQEYFRAIGEYERFLFLYPNNPEAPTAALRIAQCYHQGKRWDEALEAVEGFLREYPQSPLVGQASLLKARILSELGRGEEAREEYRAIIASEPLESIKARAWYFMGLSYAKDGRWLEADEAFGQIVVESRLYGAGQEVRQILAEASTRKRKSPTTAGVLAAILPGAGHLYCERPGDAAVAFLLTGVFVLATVEAFDQNNDGLGVGLTVVTAAIYAGNIFSAVNVAHKFNQREDRILRDRLAPYQKTSLGGDRPVSASLSFKFYF